MSHAVPMPAMFEGRPVPYAPEAEMCVLAGMWMDPHAVDVAMEVLGDGSGFHREAHRVLYQTMVRLHENGDPLDFVTIPNDLRAHDNLGKVGGLAFLSTLVDAVPTAANIEYHARIVRDKALRRRLAEVGTAIVQSAHDPRDVGDLVDAAETAIMEVGQGAVGTEDRHVDDILWPTFEIIERRVNAPAAVTGLHTGFDDLDEITAGFQRGDLIVVAARPSMGKSSFANGLAEYSAIDRKVGAMIFSLEMSRELILQQGLARRGRVSNSRIRTGRLADHELARLASAAGQFKGKPIWYDDSPSASVLEVRAKVRRRKAKNPELGLVVVDYLQLMRGAGRTENRQQEVAEISRGLKALAKETHTAVVALSQLSRAVEQRPDKRPIMSDLRESGSVEQDADVIMFLYRPEYYFGPVDKEGNSIEGRADLTIAKQRNGATGRVDLAFTKEFVLFEQLGGAR